MVTHSFEGDGLRSVNAGHALVAVGHVHIKRLVSEYEQGSVFYGLKVVHEGSCRKGSRRPHAVSRIPSPNQLVLVINSSVPLDQTGGLSIA
jgi:hypothetical protein